MACRSLPTSPPKKSSRRRTAKRVNGWVRTSKPGFPFEREVLDAWFRFENGELVAWDAAKGKDVLDQLFEMKGARWLGELSLVDVRSPINQAGMLFHDTLFDENAACHIAFGRGYPEGIEGGNQMSQDEVEALGLNSSDAHEDSDDRHRHHGRHRYPGRRQRSDDHGQGPVHGRSIGVTDAESKAPRAMLPGGFFVKAVMSERSAACAAAAVISTAQVASKTSNAGSAVGVSLELACMSVNATAVGVWKVTLTGPCRVVAPFNAMSSSQYQ